MVESPSGWSFGKVVGVIVGLIGMAGFGVCTLCGLFIGINDDFRDFGIWVLAGGVLTALSVWLVTAMFRKAREEREARDRTP
jgi:hypothetical protein